MANDIKQTLTRLGYEVPLTVATGEAALEATGRLRPDLVLMDIKLRGKMDGIDSASQIRARFDTPIVYLTSHSDEGTLSRAMKTQPSGYLLKPFDDRELHTAVEVALHKHELESRLAARERWFATTLRSIGDAVIATDKNETITFMNAVAEKLTGWKGDAIGRPLSDVFRVVNLAGAAPANQVGLERSFAVEVPPNSELLLRSGERIAIDDSASPIVDDKGRVLGGVIVFRDITERRKLEARLAQAERLASLGTMAAGMAHEVNNPLSYVKANVEVCVERLQREIDGLLAPGGAPADPQAIAGLRARLVEARDVLRDAGEGTERIRHIVQDLGRFSRADDVARDLVDLPDAIETAIKMTDNTVRHHARLRRNFGTTPFVEANERQLGQVFTNLLINAAQAIGEGKADSNEIAVTTSTDPDGNAVVEVRDTGPGIPPEVLPRIFDPFFTTKEVGAGMGLGLAICHNIVSGLGGQLTAETPPGGGALFRVLLPAARPVSETKPIAASVAPGRRGKVLVIDDEPAVAVAMARMLRAEHDVSTESDAQNAIARLSAGEEYDVVLCDLMMPTLSGMDVYEAVLAARPAQAARMVFMSGGVFSERARLFLERTTQPQIAKPFSTASVRELVRNQVAARVRKATG